MNNVAKKMDFDVEVNLKEKGNLYNIKIDLENEVEDSHAREFAINLAGAIVRNNFQKVYGTTLNDEELSKLIKVKLNSWMPTGVEFKATNVVAAPKLAKTR